MAQEGFEKTHVSAQCILVMSMHNNLPLAGLAVTPFAIGVIIPSCFNEKLSKSLFFIFFF